MFGVQFWHLSGLTLTMLLSDRTHENIPRSRMSAAHPVQRVECKIHPTDPDRCPNVLMNDWEKLLKKDQAKLYQFVSDATIWEPSTSPGYVRERDFGIPDCWFPPTDLKPKLRIAAVKRAADFESDPDKWKVGTALVMAKFSNAENSSCNDEKYKVGHKPADKVSFIVFVVAKPKKKTNGSNDVIVGKWQSIMYDTKNSTWEVKKRGHDFVMCGHPHDSLPDGTPIPPGKAVAEFMTCEDGARLTAAAAESKQSLASTLGRAYSAREVSKTGPYTPQILGTEFSTAFRTTMNLFLTSWKPESDPAWMTCILGCCVAEF